MSVTTCTIYTQHGIERCNAAVRTACHKESSLKEGSQRIGSLESFLPKPDRHHFSGIKIETWLHTDGTSYPARPDDLVICGNTEVLKAMPVVFSREYSRAFS